MTVPLMNEILVFKMWSANKIVKVLQAKSCNSFSAYYAVFQCDPFVEINIISEIDKMGI